ncbi:translation initiation factor eIF-2A [Athelia psychrophila]|uniref:Eukaryotic translation initiation factor 2A n=1 Tax=Athelia psychrophila TaxID=1759441 RepID=A0A166BQF5_9AGAM|nr:translation initiation factor eIF-2A [Fibularhizoctonia sp. CBS 109695]
MSSQISQQFAFRAQKSLGLVGGTPTYLPVEGFASPDVPGRTYHYSADGRLYAYALPTGVRIYQAEGAQLIQDLSLPNILELKFSPRGTYLSTFERPNKLEDGSQHKNLRVFSTSTGEELVSFSQKYQESGGWDLQYTISESHAVRLVSGEVQVFKPAEWERGIMDKLKVEGATSVVLSPGLNPSLAVFIAEKKGAPASIKIYALALLASPPTCSKSFYKADRATIKWNTLGTQVLLLTQTEVDNSNKSYYGETGLYLLSAAGNFDCRVTLDKEGPIHDFTWSPNSKEFGVVYGYMPAKTVIYDQRVRTLHDFGSAPHNFISFNPHGRLLILAGFGNLAGKMDIIDRKTLQKVCTIDAPNTSHCEWSPDGRFILTATLSPRLRVDNGIKIWHCAGALMHVQAVEELYQASWRPAPIDAVAPFPAALPAAPAPSPSVAGVAGLSDKPAATKPAGAYRPPGARGQATPAMFKREDEGGAVTPTPGRNGNGNGAYARPGQGPGGYQGQNGNGNGQQNGGRRHVPGAPQSPAPDGGEKKNKKKKEKKKEGGKDRDGNPNGRAPGGPNGNGNGEGALTPIAPVAKPAFIDISPALTIEAVADGASVPPTPGGDLLLDPVAKKVRNLNKKLKAIDELKEKLTKGERLEVTQLKKIQAEAELRKELAGLGPA